MAEVAESQSVIEGIVILTLPFMALLVHIHNRYESKD
jgi:hypothetical protein